MINDDGIDGSSRIAQSGLRRLMLKLPAQRQRLRSLRVSASWPSFRELFEAYDEACIALESFRRDDASSVVIKEYETLCGELEAEIVRALDRLIIWPRD